MSLLLQEGNSNLINPHISKMENYGWGDIGRIANLCPNNGQSEHLFGVYPFYIVKGNFHFISSILLIEIKPLYNFTTHFPLKIFCLGNLHLTVTFF